MNTKISYLNILDMIADLKKLETRNQKVLHSVNRTFEGLKPVIQSYNKSIEDINIDFCSVDANGDILFDEKGGYKFNRENFKLRNEAIQKLNESLFEIEIKELLDTAVISSLNPLDKEILSKYNFIPMSTN